MMWSIESMAEMRSVGVDVLVVDLNGSGRLSPQSPRESEDGVVSIACNLGEGWVAVPDVKSAVSVKSRFGGGSGGGREKTREFRSRLAIGDNFLEDISALVFFI